MRVPFMFLGISLSLVSGLRAQDSQTQGSVEARLSALEASFARQENGKDFRAYWKNGLHFETEDKSVTLKIGGRLMWDTAWFGEDSDYRAVTGAGVPNGTEFRWARLYSSGTIGDHVGFKLQLDFAGTKTSSTPVLKDAWISLRNLPGIQTLRFGRFKEYLGLEKLESSKYITFMEYAMTSSLAPSRQSGAGAEWLSESKRILAEAGVFMTTNSSGFAQADGNGAITVRVAGQPMWESKTQFVHVGAAVSYRNTSADGFSFRPGMHLGSKVAGMMPADGTLLYGLEAAWNDGPLSIQGEWIGKSISGGTGVADATINAFYIQGGYFLTSGDSRGYSQAHGVFTRVKPQSPLSFGGDNSGIGALEAAVRYDWISTDDGPFSGTPLAIDVSTITAGLNWYWNNNARVMLNYVYAILDPQAGSLDSGTSNALGLRFQVDF